MVIDTRLTYTNAKARRDGRALFRASHSGVIRVWLPLWLGVWLELIDIGGGEFDRCFAPEQGQE
jgi:hypothetical protein